MQYNRIRTLLPYLIALTASSPMVEGRLTGTMDNRLIYYRENQKEIPAICNGIIPARLRSVAEYQMAQERIFSAPGPSCWDPLRGMAQFERAYHPVLPGLP